MLDQATYKKVIKTKSSQTLTICKVHIKMKAINQVYMSLTKLAKINKFNIKTKIKILKWMYSINLVKKIVI